MLTFILPIGPWLSLLGKLIESGRRKLTRDSRHPELKSEAPSIGFSQRENLPLPENAIVGDLEKLLQAGEFTQAKELLINAWTNSPNYGDKELRLNRLKEGFIKLYIAKGQVKRAERISQMPTLMLDQEVKWIVTHPDLEIAGIIEEAD